MRKPASLRAALVAANPGLAVDPDRFLVFVKSGRIVSRWTAARGFEYRYPLHIGLLDFAGDPAAIFLPLLAWLRIEQSDLLASFERGDDAIKFEADILDEKNCDLHIEIELSEAIRVVPRDGGGFDLVHLPEPDLATMIGADLGEPIPALAEIWLDGAKLVG